MTHNNQSNSIVTLEGYNAMSRTESRSRNNIVMGQSRSHNSASKSPELFSGGSDSRAAPTDKINRSDAVRLINSKSGGGLSKLGMKKKSSIHDDNIEMIPILTTLEPPTITSGGTGMPTTRS